MTKLSPLTIDSITKYVEKDIEATMRLYNIFKLKPWIRDYSIEMEKVVIDGIEQWLAKQKEKTNENI